MASHLVDEDEEVTDAEASAVLDELFASGKIGSAVSQKKSSLTLGPKTRQYLGLGGQAAKAAVAFDSSGEHNDAIVSYERSISYFADALGDSALAEKHSVALINSMESYLDRIIDLRLKMRPDFASSPQSIYLKAFGAMSNRGYSVLKRGVSLYKRVKESDPPCNNWVAFVIFTESVECLSEYLKSGDAKNQTVIKCVADMRARIATIMGSQSEDTHR
jgi:hypothetical protein